MVTGLLITLLILLIITLLLLIRVKIIVEYSSDEVKLGLRILGIKISLIPRKEKKKKVRLKDYSYKALEKRRIKEAKKKDKPQKKESKKQKHVLSSQKDAPFTEKLSLITGIVKYLISRFFRYLRIDLTRVIVVVGSSDAAKTAVMYGIINQGVALLLDILGAITNIKRNKKTDISVSPDFTKEKIEADIKLAFSLQVWQAFAIALGTLFRFISKTMNKEKNN